MFIPKNVPQTTREKQVDRIAFLPPRHNDYRKHGSPSGYCLAMTLCTLAFVSTGTHLVTSPTHAFAQPNTIVTLATQDQKQEPMPKYLFSEDTSIPVITLDIGGGFRAPIQDFQREPTLEIYADGRVVGGRNSPVMMIGEAKLSPPELQRLLDFIIEKHNFLETSPENIKQELVGYRSMLADGPTSTVKVFLKDKNNQLSVYALKLTARQLPNAVGVQNLLEIETQLRQVKVLADAGGKQALQELLDSVNAKLRTQLPDQEPLGVPDVRNVQRKADQSLTASFFRKIANDPNNRGINATVSRPTADAALSVQLVIQ